MADLGLLPLSSFDPRLRDLIERGCKETVEIACETSRKAHHLRNVLTTFRSRMRKAHPTQPELWEPLYGAIISTKKNFPHVVTIRSRMHEFDDLFTKLSLDPAPVVFEGGEDPLDTIMREMESKNDNAH